MTENWSLDSLIVRLRERAADPERRVDMRATALETRAHTLDLGALVAELGSTRRMLGRVVAANRGGAVDPAGITAADRIAEDMRPLAGGQPADPASALDLDAAERSLAIALPASLRRIYREVTNGGFGPGSGLHPIASAVSLYLGFRATSPGPRGSVWPERLLPLTGDAAGCDSIDLVTGSIVAWDPEGLREFSRTPAWLRTFTAVAPSVEAWLGGWLDRRTPQEQIADSLAGYQVAAARAARASIAAKTPEERAAMGLPAVGWERVVWGGLGLD